MIEKTSLTCIICPMGCRLDLEVEDGKVVKVEGNSCARGPKYAQSEYTAPVRTLTTTVKLADGGLLPVRCAKPIPKAKLFEAMELTKTVVAKAPVKRGDVLMADFIEEGNALIACKTVD
nr:DUF1667 domain-containing protein [Clostridia bacterium]